MKQLIAISMTAVLLSSCAVFTPRKPEVMRYHKRIKSTQTINELEKSKRLFEVNAFVLDPNSGASKNIFDLSAEGQAALIEAASKSSKNTQELSAAIASAIKDAPVNSLVRNNAIWKKRVVLNITRIDKEKANRLQYILFTVNIPDSMKDKVELVSWDKIVTETQAIDLGKITSGTTTAHSFTPEITMAGKVIGASAGSVSNTRTFSEEKALSARAAGLNAAIVSPQKFQVLRQALPNEDISGNIVIELTLRSTDVNSHKICSFTGLFDNNIPVADQSKVKMNSTVVIEPGFVAPVNLNYNFRYRSVGRGAATEPEGDDIVTNIDGKINENNRLKLFSKDDAIKLWDICDGENKLHIIKDGEMQSLLFNTFEGPAQLLNWLKLTKNLKVAGGDLYLGSDKLTASAISNLVVKISDDPKGSK